MGGLASRRLSFKLVAAINQWVSLPIIGALALAFPAGAPSPGDVGAAVASGLFSTAGLFILYPMMQKGSMGVLAAVTGVMSAVLPLLWALRNGEELSTFGVAGIVVALCSIVLFSGSGDGFRFGEHQKQVMYSAIAGMSFGFSWALIADVGQTGGFSVLLIMRLAGALAATVLLGRGLARLQPTADWWKAAASGLGALIATVVFVIGARLQVVSIVAVLQGLAPLTTALLARMVLAQRLRRRQVVGLGTAFVALALLSL